MAKKKKEPEMVKLYLYEGESGWGELLRKNPARIRIANIPYGGRFNIDDIVTVKPLADSPLPIADRLLERVYPVRTAIWYDRPEQFKILMQLVRNRGGKGEGAFGPIEERQGAAAVAMKSEADVIEVLQELGLEDRQPEGWPVNDLMPDPRDWSPPGKE